MHPTPFCNAKLCRRSRYRYSLYYKVKGLQMICSLDYVTRPLTAFVRPSFLFCVSPCRNTQGWASPEFSCKENQLEWTLLALTIQANRLIIFLPIFIRLSTHAVNCQCRIFFTIPAWDARNICPCHCSFNFHYISILIIFKLVKSTYCLDNDQS